MKLRNTALLLAALSPLAIAADPSTSPGKPLPLFNRWFSIPTESEEESPAPRVEAAKPFSPISPSTIG